MENTQKAYARLWQKLRRLSAAGALSLSLTGCFSSKELATNKSVTYDTIDTMDKDALKNGITQTLDVPGEKFKLVITYQCELKEDERWTVTSNKQLNMEIKTEGLTNEKVYIDNIHTDTTICSHYAEINGIIQDTMDDRIHNSLMPGFSISDTNSYIGINQIDGQNDTFIQGFINGWRGYTQDKITEQRFSELDYLEKGVYANLVSSIIDLIIVKGNQTTFVSVPSEVQISVWPYIQIQNLNETYYRYYYLNEKGEMDYYVFSEDEYLIQTQINSRKLTK